MPIYGTTAVYAVRRVSDYIPFRRVSDDILFRRVSDYILSAHYEYCRGADYILFALCHIIIHTMSHHHSYYVTYYLHMMGTVGWQTHLSFTHCRVADALTNNTL